MKFWLSLFLCALLVAFAVLLYDSRDVIFIVKEYIGGSHTFSQLAYVFLLFSVGVYLPLNAIPLIPFGAAIFGPYTGALLSFTGWLAGASVAFLLSRFYGRTVIEKLVPLEKVDALMESFPEERRLFMLIIFRLVLPSDMASYALGLAKSLSFKHYFIATGISYSVYSILLSFLGSRIYDGRIREAALFGVGALAIFVFSWYLLRYLRK
jgi:uncharacterized membrane protein YdjX (TVP38/TMEM64 family)